MRVETLETTRSATQVLSFIRRTWDAYRPHAGYLRSFDQAHRRAARGEWWWLRHSRLLSKDSDLEQWIRDPERRTRETWWVAHHESGEILGVLQLRVGVGGSDAKIHGLVVRRPGGGAGSALVRRALAEHPQAWVGAHPSAKAFYAKLGFSPIPGAQIKPSEIPMRTIMCGKSKDSPHAARGVPDVQHGTQVRHARGAGERQAPRPGHPVPEQGGDTPVVQARRHILPPAAPADV